MQIYGNQGGKTYYWDSQRKINKLFRREGNVCISVCKDSGIPQSTIWSIIKKEDYEVREKIYIRSVRGWEFQ